MDEPLVCCVTITHREYNRLSFPSQTYLHKRWQVFRDLEAGVRPIGTTRNIANRKASDTWGADVLAHMDSDDLSLSCRISEQVALLQSSGADVVGYRSMLFADVRNGGCEAWVYQAQHKNSDYCIGTSLCYYRRVWEAVPFPPLPDPNNWQSPCEDTVWQMQVKMAGMKIVAVDGFTDNEEPKMIATLHGSNSKLHLWPWEKLKEYTRRPDWDERTRKILEGA